MQVYGHIQLESHRNRWGHLRQQYESGNFEVVRLIGPAYGAMTKGEQGRQYIRADVKVPARVSDCVERWLIQPDGTCRIEIAVAVNYEVLKEFLASGDQEWDVRDRP